MSDGIYDKFLEYLKKDQQLTPFPSPDLHRRQPRSTGFILNGNPENVFYLIEDKRFTYQIMFQWSSPEACQKIDEIKTDKWRPYAAVINIKRLSSDWNRVRYS